MQAATLALTRCSWKAQCMIMLRGWLPGTPTASQYLARLLFLCLFAMEAGPGLPHRLL